MKLSEFCGAGRGAAARLAAAVGVTPVLISQWSSGVRPVPIDRCVPLERATGGQVTRKDLRPSDWQEIWPELADGVDGADRRHPDSMPPDDAAVVVQAGEGNQP